MRILGKIEFHYIFFGLLKSSVYVAVDLINLCFWSLKMKKMIQQMFSLRLEFLNLKRIFKVLCLRCARPEKRVDLKKCFAQLCV